MAHLTHRRQHKARARDGQRSDLASFRRAIKLVKPTAGAWDSFHETIKQSDQELSKALLGQSMLFDASPRTFPPGTFSNHFTCNASIDAGGFEMLQRTTEELKRIAARPLLREVRVSGLMPALGHFKDQGVMYLGYEAFDKLVASLPAAKGQLGHYLGIPVYDDRIACPSSPVCQFDVTPEEPCNC